MILSIRASGALFFRFVDRWQLLLPSPQLTPTKPSPWAMAPAERKTVAASSPRLAKVMEYPVRAVKKRRAIVSGCPALHLNISCTLAERARASKGQSLGVGVSLFSI